MERMEIESFHVLEDLEGQDFASPGGGASGEVMK